MSAAVQADGNAIPSILAIKLATAAHFGTSILDLESARRTIATARPRQAAMYLARQMTLHSMPAIARQFGGRDHTTVIHAIRKIEELLPDDADLRDRIDRVRSEVARGAPQPRLIATSLEDASRLGIVEAVRSAKAGRCTVEGDCATLREVLAEAFGEHPEIAMLDAAGVLMEILVAPNGSWSRLEIDGDRAVLAAAGTRWGRP